MPSIDINEPIGGSTVGVTFRAAGTFDPASGTPVIALSSSTGAPITAGAGTVLIEVANWSVAYTNLNQQSGVKLTATMTGATTAVETNITILDTPPVGIDSIDPERPAKGVVLTIKGSYTSADVDCILVTAFDYAPGNYIDPDTPNSGILASAGAVLTPDEGTWQCRLSFETPANIKNRVMVRVLALTKKGKIIGNLAKRQKKA